MDSRILPEQFADAYEALWTMAYRDGGNGGAGGTENHPLDGRSSEVGRASGKAVKKGKDERGDDSARRAGAQLIKDGKKTSNFGRNHCAERTLRRYQKRLRRMAKELLAAVSDLEIGGSGGSPPPSRRCAGRCGKISEADWSYCAWCGGPTRQLDPGESAA